MNQYLSKKTSILCFVLSLFVTPQSFAIITELSLSGFYSRSTLDANNYTESQVASSSIAFYLWSRSALEFSYTHRITVQKSKASASSVPSTVTATLEELSADFVLSFADRQAAFQPFIKLGVSYPAKKQYTIQDEGFPSSTLNVAPATNPGGGAGVKIKLSQTFSLKLETTARSTTNLDRSKTVDSLSRVGLSWLF